MYVSLYVFVCDSNILHLPLQLLLLLFLKIGHAFSIFRMYSFHRTSTFSWILVRKLTLIVHHGCCKSSSIYCRLRLQSLMMNFPQMLYLAVHTTCGYVRARVYVCVCVCVFVWLALAGIYKRDSLGCHNVLSCVCVCVVSLS